MGGTDPYVSVEMLTGRPLKPINIKLPRALVDAVDKRSKADGKKKPWIVRTLLFLYVTGRIDLGKLADEAGL